MVDVIILGTIGLDTLETPFGKVQDAIGGTAIYASYAASFFSKPGIISVKGKDLDEKELEFLKKNGISLSGIKTDGKTFKWHGKYEYDMHDAKTLKTELNSLATFKPKVPDDYKKAKYIFLGNFDPTLQLSVINQIEKPELVVLDTMNYWIEKSKTKLIEVIKKTDILLLNDGEARQLFETPNLVKAAKQALALGLKGVIIKKGEHGALLFTKNFNFSCPGYPLENVIDPTGCGDTFGGAFIGYYSKYKDLRKAMVYGSILASFNAEGFGIENLRKITDEDIKKRYSEMVELRKF